MITDDEFRLVVARDSNGAAHYLKLLNLHWSPAGVEYDIESLRSSANRLRGEPEFLSALFRTSGSWRDMLLGCVCLLLSGERKYFKDLLDCFKHGSFVSPQVAVTLGLLHPEESKLAFAALLRDQDFRRSAKNVVSAQRVLERLGVLGELDVKLTAWHGREHEDATVANQVVIKHWSFWAPYVQK